jgi:hypothetical protein
MPHGISGFRARRLAREIERFFLNFARHLQSLSDEEARIEKAKQEVEVSYVEMTALTAYLRGVPDDTSVPFGGTVRMPEREIVILAAEGFGRVMNKPELLELAEAVRQRGL